jgi:hypothetical protein
MLGRFPEETNSKMPDAIWLAVLAGCTSIPQVPTVRWFFYAKAELPAQAFPCVCLPMARNQRSS